MSGYPEFPEEYVELAESQDGDSPVLAQLRAALKKAAKINQEGKKLYEGLQGDRRASVIEKALEKLPEGARAKVANLVPESLQTANEINEWVNDHADVFVTSTGPVDTPVGDGESTQDQSSSPVTDDVKESARRAQATEAAGTPPHLSATEFQKVLERAEAAETFDERMQILREAGMTR